ncbi:galactonate dehydratase [Parenemella sanctibonifatiensis]|uniref:galactonate dehydratase n=1 Tax=Parenemella sanctibonifatiensis TaxID=2016505 RepID=UPI001E2B72DF|nr:galactonate dehydratase [Parenemella sanctibonifatiensis]
MSTSPDTITRIETFLVPPRWLFVRIETAEGLVGWGEATCEGRSETVRAAVEQLAELAIGRDPGRIEDLWQLLTNGSFYRGGPILASAVAGIDQALWDILGKRLGVPVHQLLGGAVRDRIRIYGWIGGDEPGGVAEAAAAARDNGLTAIKMNATPAFGKLATRAEVSAAVARAEAAREAMGEDGDVAIDFHGRVSFPAARTLIKALEPVAPMFIEEPVVPENSHLFGDLVAHTHLPIATGERLYNRQEFLPVLCAGVGVVQPDLSHAGGITETRKIASLADAHGALLAPHCPLGPLALAACLQVGFATSNHVIQEQSLGIHYNQGADLLDLVLDSSMLATTDGWLPRWDAPGLGIEIDEAAVRRADQSPHGWRGPVWQHPDGSYAEW